MPDCESATFQIEFDTRSDIEVEDLVHVPDLVLSSMDDGVEYYAMEPFIIEIAPEKTNYIFYGIENTDYNDCTAPRIRAGKYRLSLRCKNVKAITSIKSIGFVAHLNSKHQQAWLDELERNGIVLKKEGKTCRWVPPPAAPQPPPTTAPAP